jgi:hypothetical protein
VDFDAVEASLKRVLGSGAKIADNLLDLVDCQGAGRVIGAGGTVGPASFNRYVTRTHRLLPSSEGWRRGASSMPDLAKYVAALSMNSIRDFLPARNLGLCENSWCSRVPSSLSIVNPVSRALIISPYKFRNVSRLSQLQAAFRRSLTIILYVKIIWNCDSLALLCRAHTSQRCLYNSVLELDSAQLERCKESCILQLLEPSWGVCFWHSCSLEWSRIQMWEYN